MDEVRRYVEHRIRVAGYSGPNLFTQDALTEIARFTEGIPRNINNFCFNVLSLGCALQQKPVDSAIVREVISDLDISKLGSLSTPPPPEPVYIPKPLVAPVPPPIPPRGKNGEHLSPAEAKAYMQQISDRLKDWQESLNRVVKHPGSEKPN